MRALIEGYLWNSLSLSIIALLIMVFSPLLSRRYSAKCRYYLWVVIFAALLLPIRLEISIPLPEFLRAMLSSNTDGISAILPSGTSASGTMQVSNARNTGDWIQYAVLLWGIGIVCFLGWHIFQHMRFLTSVKRWSESIEDMAMLELFTGAKDELGIRGNIVLKSCACIKTPMLVGLWRPAVLIPQNSFHQEELPLILNHELVHHKRRDLWYKVLMMLVLAIHWYNPAVHLMVKSALNLCEISCDEEVLKKIDAKGRAKYGESILGVIRNGGACQTALSTNFYSGAKGMKQRIYAMMDMRGKRFSPILFLVILIMTLCGATTFALAPAQAKNIADSRLSDTAIQSQEGTSAAGAQADSAAKSGSNDKSLPAGKTAPGNNQKKPERNLNYVIVQQNPERNSKFTTVWQKQEKDAYYMLVPPKMD